LPAAQLPALVDTWEALQETLRDKLSIILTILVMEVCDDH
jgi:hypothetical protein